uniref:Surface protein Sur1 putative n=1 Tax=Albugo laibachii Nc14 TaxID=890382 RepID=F0W3M3_9STRA|nr:surface protein Sur1 putative [Albugo laibachii Nc14]CCA16270.1 surface protein Sur1 putative [Albugo laibachii Nc14]|eukprot:CCA16270.1 surface protein Sur1 putative [Albugo laibachii Nc14]
MTDMSANRICYIIRNHVLIGYIYPIKKRKTCMSIKPNPECKWNFWSPDDRDWNQALLSQSTERLCDNQMFPTVDNAVRIPFIIHQIWLGPHPIPAFCLQQMETWRQIHPQWEYKLWTDTQVSTLKLQNKEHFDLAGNYGEKSDILRYEILLQFGGIYVDVDFKCLRLFQDLLQAFSFITGISNTDVVELNNGLIACTRNHPIVRELVASLASKAPVMSMTDARILDTIAQFTTEKLVIRQSNEFMQTISQTGPGLLTKTFMRAIGWKSGSKCIPGFLTLSESKDVIALPRDYFYSIPNHLSHQEKLDFKIPPEAMAIGNIDQM